MAASEPVGSLHLADPERGADAHQDEDGEDVDHDGEPRRVPQDRQGPVGIDHRQHRLDDRGQQHQEPPEDERVHQARHRLLEQLALAEHVRELAGGAGRGVVGATAGPGSADQTRPLPAPSEEQHERRRQDGREREGAQEPARRRISCVRAGTTAVRSPTTARSASCMIGASASLLIAMMRAAPFMPTMCCSAPLIPTAM